MAKLKMSVVITVNNYGDIIKKEQGFLKSLLHKVPWLAPKMEVEVDDKLLHAVYLGLGDELAETLERKLRERGIAASASINLEKDLMV